MVSGSFAMKKTFIIVIFLARAVATGFAFERDVVRQLLSNDPQESSSRHRNYRSPIVPRRTPVRASSRTLTPSSNLPAPKVRSLQVFKPAPSSSLRPPLRSYGNPPGVSPSPIVRKPLVVQGALPSRRFGPEPQVSFGACAPTLVRRPAPIMPCVRVRPRRIHCGAASR